MLLSAAPPPVPSVRNIEGKSAKLGNRLGSALGESGALDTYGFATQGFTFGGGGGATGCSTNVLNLSRNEEPSGRYGHSTTSAEVEIKGDKDVSK